MYSLFLKYKEMEGSILCLSLILRTKEHIWDDRKVTHLVVREVKYEGNKIRLEIIKRMNFQVNNI